MSEISLCFFFFIAYLLTYFHLAAPEHFRYTNQGGDANIAGTDDVMEMERTRNAFTILGRM